jgi:hypothetical protein
MLRVSQIVREKKREEKRQTRIDKKRGSNSLLARRRQASD